MRRRFARSLRVLTGLWLAAPLFGQTPVDFSRQIRPLLSDRCFICHGPDEEARESDLRLDLRAGALADLGGHAAIVPGHPDQSRLLERVRHPKERRRMPPPSSKLSLSNSEIELLERWIAEGANYQEHWAFIAPKKPSLPLVARAEWPRDDLDRFVLAQLEELGVDPSPEVEREVWLRRVSFDLNGLPPTLQELDNFLADDSADAFERVVDRLLASPRYGERMASEWLDAARYADTYGYQNDRERRVWPWRDWVVRAFNADLPWDDFATWQLAGDLLPEATTEQRLATAFNRLHRQTNEGGSVEEEYRVEYVADRVHTFGTSFLGLTMECARCHDHKYDPISQRDYYSLFAFFDDIDESGLYSHFTDAVPTPTLWLPTVEQERELAELTRRRDAAESALARGLDGLQGEFTTWASGRPTPATLEAPVGFFDFEREEESALPNGGTGEPKGKLNDGAVLAEGRDGQVLRLTGEDSASFAGLAEFSRDDPFTIALWLRCPDVRDRAVVFHRSQAWTDSGSRGYQLLIEEGRLSASLIHFWPGNALSVRTVEPLKPGQWTHVALVYDGSSRAAGLELWVDGRRAEVEVVRDGLTRTIQGGGNLVLTLGQRFRDRGFSGGEVDDLAVFDRRLTSAELAALFDSDSGTPSNAPLDFDEGTRALRDYFDATQSVAARRLRDDLNAARKAWSALADRIPEIMTMRELPVPRRAFLLQRGSYLSHGDPVQPGTPASVLSYPADLRADRLGLAQWLVSDDNPLFARVAVNRLWQMTFGLGLVSTAENFGSQGLAPVQQDLLDFLAIELRESGWSVKALLRRLTLSSTYRQSSKATAEQVERDPQNAWLARGPRRSLSAEMIRDNALFVSGLLVERLGGPSVKPYEPPGLWLEKSGIEYEPDLGEGLWRRSLYTYWKRTSPPPSMMIFDAAKRDVCVVKRQHTNSPLQALALWNDPQQVEAARHLAQRVLKESPAGSSDRERLQSLFRRCTSRPANDAELMILIELLEAARADFSAAAGSAEAWLSVGHAKHDAAVDPGELAALAVVANTMLGFDGTLTLR